MHVDVMVDLEGETLVAIKRATGAEAVARVGREAARLSEARHPGVVDLLDCRDLAPAASGPGRPADPVREMRMGYAGEPLTRWTGSLSDVAGVAASVASTLADLHDAGIVHGRLDASHVLLGGSGHPRLCGWAGPAGADRADDVAAWGRLLDELVARAPGTRRRRRARGGPAARRALLAVAERATDPVPTRRPPARALADAVVAAVPAATLPHGRGPDPGGGLPPRALAAPPEPDALERIWSYPGEPSEDERWAAALGSSPAGAGATRGVRHRAPGAPPAHDAPPARRPGPLDTATHHPVAGGTAAVEPLHDEPAGPDHRPARSPEDPRHLHAAGHGPSGRPGDGDPDDRDRRRRPVGTRRATAPEPRPSRRHARVTALVALAVLGAGGLVLAVAPGGAPDGGDGAPRSAAGGPGCGPVTSPAADVDGDGCPEALAVSGSTVDAGAARWTLGQPGDVVALGDWDCDGEASAALLRPRSGDVFVFSTWAAPGEPVTVTPVRRVVGAAAIRAVPSGTSARPCDRLVVDRRGGRPETVAVAG